MHRPLPGQEHLGELALSEQGQEVEIVESVTGRESARGPAAEYGDGPAGDRFREQPGKVRRLSRKSAVVLGRVGLATGLAADVEVLVEQVGRWSVRGQLGEIPKIVFHRAVEAPLHAELEVKLQQL